MVVPVPLLAVPLFHRWNHLEEYRCIAIQKGSQPHGIQWIMRS